MKVMSRNFNRAEKFLLLVLVLILMALVYYWFVDQTVRDSISRSTSEAELIQQELTVVEARVAELQKIQDSMDALKEEGNLTWMGSYNNSPEEVAFLNEILGNTLKFSISFANVTRSGDQIRRSFTLQFQTPDYESARDIMTRLVTGKNRCLTGDLRCSIDKNGLVTINESATFYETMVGGSPDAALPVDSAAVNQ